MVMAERRGQIVELVNREGNVSFAQLKLAFPQVSEMTLRTDLKALDEQRLIIRVHGGAKSVGFALGTDDLLSRRAGRHVAEKIEIAHKAAGLIKPSRTVFIDSGSTTTALASVLEDIDLMVFTNSITVANELARLERPICYLLGGKINRYSMSTFGGATIQSLISLTIDQAFVGVTGYKRGEGFSCGSDDETTFKQMLVERAHETVVLMDSSKEGRPSTFRVCGLSDVDTVVSDGDLSEDFRSACAEAEVTLL